ncbi:MAG TPA: SprB repeat-containing protein, partial [Ferruginibacter sp.]|nr:SprB repeat-containing protein [Ferruginibacter sp.]
GPDPKDDPDHGGAFFNLATFVSNFPNARIMNDVAKGGAAIRLTVGGPVFSKNFIGDADNFKIGVKGVTVIYDFEFTIANAGDDKKINGYWPKFATLIGFASGGVAPYTYSWSDGKKVWNQREIKVRPFQTTTYTLTVTDANECIGTDEVTVFVK